jgi:hypothetical protein
MRQSPQISYLLRVLVLLIVLLTVWWVALDPILGSLRLSTELAFRVMFPFSAATEITVVPGGWHIKAPVPQSIGQRDDIQQIFGRKSKADPPVKVRSLQLDIPPRRPTLFTVSLPFFWAMTIAAPWTRRTLRILLIGTLALGFIATLSMVYDVVYTFVNFTHMVIGDFTRAVLDTVNYFNLNAVPYIAPMFSAVALNAALRTVIFTFQPAPEAAPEPLRRVKGPASQ